MSNNVDTNYTYIYGNTIRRNYNEIYAGDKNILDLKDGIVRKEKNYASILREIDKLDNSKKSTTKPIKIAILLGFIVFAIMLFKFPERTVLVSGLQTNMSYAAFLGGSFTTVLLPLVVLISCFRCMKNDIIEGKITELKKSLNRIENNIETEKVNLSASSIQIGSKITLE